MNFYIMKLLSLVLSIWAFLGGSILSGVVSQPMGVASYDLPAESDLKVGVTFHRDAVFVGSVSSVLAGTVGFVQSLPDLSPEKFFLLVTNDSSAISGQWFEITSATSNSVTVSEDLQALQLSSADQVKIIPFWTLDTLFENGGGLPVSSDVFDSQVQILINPINLPGINLPTVQAYFYHDGSMGPAGWYDVSNPSTGLKNSTALTPDSFLTIRNYSAQNTTLNLSGFVPASTIATSVLSSSSYLQDSLIYNPYPKEISLLLSKLVDDQVVRASSDVFDPIDTVLIYSYNTGNINPSTTSAYFYHDGSMGAAGWYDVSDPSEGIKNLDTIPAGSAIVIRRGIGNNEIIFWKPTLPYNLDS